MKEYINPSVLVIEVEARDVLTLSEVGTNIQTYENKITYKDYFS